MVDNRKTVDCVHDKADSFLIAMLESGYAEVELRVWFGVGGDKVGRLRAEMKDPTLQARKLPDFL